MAQQTQARLDQLKTHPAQMRTTYNLEKLAELVVKIFHQGLHEWQPILIGKNGSDRAPIISGHRRHLAVTFSQYLPVWLKEEEIGVETEKISIQQVNQMLNALVKSENNIAFAADMETAVSQILPQVGSLKIPVQLFSDAGDAASEMMALISSNYGGEAPDMLGEAVAFQAALLEAKAPKQIANEIGKSEKYVTDRVALVNIDQELAKLIVSGKFSLAVATAVSGLENAEKKAGLTRYILAKQDELSVGEIIKIAKKLKAWPGLSMPLIFEGNQTKRNMARILIRMWNNAIENFPEASWAAASMFIHRQAHKDPWMNKNHFELWVKSFGNGTYFVDSKIIWDKLVHELLAEVSCETCPLSKVAAPQELRNKITTQSGALGMPCRLGQKGTNCLHGFTSTDSILIRVPAAWAGLDDVEGEAGTYQVKGIEAFEAAQLAQIKREQKEEEAEILETEKAAPATTTQVAKGNAQLSNAVDVEKTSQPRAKKPVDKKRAAIRLFMESHQHLATAHPWATVCANCQNKRTDSPVKDPKVPYCNWAKGGVSAPINVWMPKQESDSGPHIPYCRQYLPIQKWKEVIPENPSPPGMSRVWMVKQIQTHYKRAATSSSDEERPLLFLIGRPLASNDSNRDWFSKQLKKQADTLTDGQLWTLCIWVINRWNGTGREQAFPVVGDGQQLEDYKLVDFNAYAEGYLQTIVIEANKEVDHE